MATTEFISLHTIKRKHEGKSLEIKPNTVFDLDPKTDAAEIDHLLKAKAMKPYVAQDSAPARLVTSGKKAAPAKKTDDSGKKAAPAKKTDDSGKTDGGSGDGAGLV
jgi:hypothetical protein